MSWNPRQFRKDECRLGDSAETLVQKGREVKGVFPQGKGKEGKGFGVAVK